MKTSASWIARPLAQATVFSFPGTVNSISGKRAFTVLFSMLVRRPECGRMETEAGLAGPAETSVPVIIHRLRIISGAIVLE